ncbi:PP2C family serine/threonine-protein phosphatase [Aggregatibacter sp. Marseille-P9115]|jgi:serine/threonine protein phosphatase PrpC|uniref:PP2C family protein-serine/threonine phosphatase n=1 Tax=Aggregatibacter sp. Marseille-P9115 TaxID=2866570 RepID=UPI001E33045D|nr:protein phosphatase 2C domain-containing protein [Aggregatibacter sp. Marseille-P9115]
MQHVCQITFCQQIGKNKKHNQDALFNGETVFQFKLKTAEKRLENRPHFIIGIADGISNSNHAEKASKCAMSALQKIQTLSRNTIPYLQDKLSEQLADTYFGSATTFVAAEIDQVNQKAKILSVGDSRAYLIDAQGKWQQITQDHSILSELLADFPDKKEDDFATIYGGVSSCLVADYSEFQDKIFYQEIEIQQGESLLLCSDGLTDGLSDEMREKIWQKYADDKTRLTVCRKMIEKQSFSDDFSVIICAF